MPKKAAEPKITNNYGSIYIGPDRKGNLTVLRGASRYKYLPKSIFHRKRMREQPMLRLNWQKSGDKMYLSSLKNLWHWYNPLDVKGESGQRQHGVHGIVALWELTRELHRIGGKMGVKSVETDYSSVGVKPQWGWRVIDEDGPLFGAYCMRVQSPKVWAKKYPRPVADAAHGKKAGAGE